MSTKRPDLDEETDSSDDDVGPSLEGFQQAVKRKRTTERPSVDTQIVAPKLPTATSYEKSYMHREPLSHVKKGLDFIITASIDGYINFWIKKDEGIEFVKRYRVFLGPILDMSVSNDERLLAVVGQEHPSSRSSNEAPSSSSSSKGAVKIFDIQTFDMINMVLLMFIPRSLCWFTADTTKSSLLGISDYESPAISLFDPLGASGEPLSVLDKMHRQSVHLMAYSSLYETAISIDVGGMIEYWSPETFEKPNSIAWTIKSETDLYHFKKMKTIPMSIQMNPSNDAFAILALPRLSVHLFSVDTGKMRQSYDESPDTIYETIQKSGTSIDSLELNRRIALEKDLETTTLENLKTMPEVHYTEASNSSSSGENDKKLQNTSIGNCVWDEQGECLLYPTLRGIKVVHLASNQVLKIYGTTEPHRFLHIALYQGSKVRKSKVVTIDMATSDNPLLNKQVDSIGDPTVFATAWKRSRFYLFSNRDPESQAGQRDVLNEKPMTKDGGVPSTVDKKTSPVLGKKGIIHTTMGDITFELYPELIPKAVENFTMLSKSGYYNGVIFHRVIPRFMVQTGDPTGDGTGGDSIWGEPFEDEFHASLKHDKPYVLSMANAGPGTNASQFFITTVATPWLDNKHTLFGRIMNGYETVHLIERVPRNAKDKPLQPIRIINIEITE